MGDIPFDQLNGHIWFNGDMVPWADSKIHILSHALHYASSVFEGERCYDGKIFLSRKHSERLHKSGEMMDMPIPYSVDEIEAAKTAVLEANGLTDAYVRAVAWRGAGPDMGVASARNPVRLAIAAWHWGSYYGDAKMKGAHPNQHHERQRTPSAKTVGQRRWIQQQHRR